MLISAEPASYPVPEQAICRTMHNQADALRSAVIVKMILVTCKIDPTPDHYPSRVNGAGRP
jgi:hypothetical protein